MANRKDEGRQKRRRRRPRPSKNPPGRPPPQYEDQYGDTDREVTAHRTPLKIEQSDDDAASVGEQPPAKKPKVEDDLCRTVSLGNLFPQPAPDCTLDLLEQAAQSVAENSSLRMRSAALGKSRIAKLEEKNEQAESRIADLEQKNAQNEADLMKLSEIAADEINEAKEEKARAEAQVKKLTEEAVASRAKGRPVLQHEHEAHLTYETLRARNQEVADMMKELSDMNAVVRRLKREEGVPSTPIHARFRNRLGIKPSPLSLYTSIDDARKEYLARNSIGGDKVLRNDGSIVKDSSEIIHRSTSPNSTDEPSGPAALVDAAALTTAIGGDADDKEKRGSEDEGSEESVPSGKQMS